MKIDNEKSANPLKTFHCKKCDYSTNDKKDWNKHILTAKHTKSTKGAENKKIVCIFCDKSYKYKSGLSRHKKKCVFQEEFFCGKKDGVTIVLPFDTNLKKGTTVFGKNEKQDDTVSLNDIVMQQLKQQNDILTQQLKQQNDTIELLKQSIETNTKMWSKEIEHLLKK
jgi:hypothetical protein